MNRRDLLVRKLVFTRMPAETWMWTTRVPKE